MRPNGRCRLGVRPLQMVDHAAVHRIDLDEKHIIELGGNSIGSLATVQRIMSEFFCRLPESHSKDGDS
jgi:hypothetical protein